MLGSPDLSVMMLYIDQQVWSKLTSGRLPSFDEVKSLVDDLSGPAGANMDSFSV